MTNTQREREREREKIKIMYVNEIVSKRDRLHNKFNFRRL